MCQQLLTAQDIAHAMHWIECLVLALWLNGSIWNLKTKQLQHDSELPAENKRTKLLNFWHYLLETSSLLLSHVLAPAWWRQSDRFLIRSSYQWKFIRIWFVAFRQTLGTWEATEKIYFLVQVSSAREIDIFRGKLPLRKKGARNVCIVPLKTTTTCEHVYSLFSLCDRWWTDRTGSCRFHGSFGQRKYKGGLCF